MNRHDLARAPLIEALTVALIAAHLLFWLTGSMGDAVYEGALVPARLTGALAPGLVPPLLTPLSSFFLHGGVLHLLFNTVVMAYCGLAVEHRLGTMRLACLLVAGCFGAALAEVLWQPMATAPIIGASGGISALIAAYALLSGSKRGRAIGPVSQNVVQAVWLGAAWVVLNLLQGAAFGLMSTPIAVASHIGGFTIGLLLTPVLKAEPTS